MSRAKFRRALIVETALVPLSVMAINLGSSAHAEEPTPPAKPATTTLSEVVVTAERRAVDIQRSALSVTAVTSKSLDQSFTNNVIGLSAEVPSLEITKASGFENLVTIRGVGSGTPENALVSVPGVSEYIDGVYIANTVSLDQTLFDIDNIQVLRGPQGALYGQSSIGGAIILETKQPKLHTFEGTGDFSAGTYDLFRERAAVNIPLGDQFAARVSLQKFDHDGFTTDAALPGVKLDAAHDESGKVALLWKPNDSFQATLSAQYYHSNQAGDAQKNINDPSPDPRVVNQDYPGHFRLTTQLYNLNLQWQGPGFQVKSVSAYQVLQNVVKEDSSRSSYAVLHATDPCLTGAPYVPCQGYDDVAAWNTTVHNFTEELDIMSQPGAKLEWIVGGFYLNQTSHQFVAEFEGTTNPTPAQLVVGPNIESDPFAYPNLAYGNDSHATHQSYSLFGQATYHLSDRLRLTAGARLNMDANADPSHNFSAFGTGFADNKSWASVPTWRVEADYDLTPTNMVYASNARGYKPGGANGENGQFLVPTTFQPETNTSFELGSKNYFLDRSLRVNASVFYYIDKNFQYIETDPVPFDAGISNVPSIHDYGMELESSYVGAEGRLHINGDLALERGYVNGSYRSIDSTISNYLEGPYFSGGNSANYDAAHAYGACAWYADYGGLNSPAAVACYKAVAALATDIKGKTPPAMPIASGSINASYRFDAPGGSLTPRVEVIYRGAEWARIFNDPKLDRVPAYTQTNLNLEYLPTGSRLRFTLTATNVFDKAGINSRYTDPYGTGQTSQQYIPPRQIIGGVAYSF